MIVGLPLLLLMLIAFNALAYRVELLDYMPSAVKDKLPDFQGDVFNMELWPGALNLKSGQIWQFNVTQLLIILTLLVLSIDVIRAASRGVGTMWSHLWAVALLAGCLAEFVFVGKANTQLFFIITAAVLVEVFLGFCIAAYAAATGKG